MDTLKKLDSIMILPLEVCHFIVKQFKVQNGSRIIRWITHDKKEEIYYNGSEGE